MGAPRGEAGDGQSGPSGRALKAQRLVLAWPYTVSVSSLGVCDKSSEARLHELNSLCLLSCFGSF